MKIRKIGQAATIRKVSHVRADGNGQLRDRPITEVIKDEEILAPGKYRGRMGQLLRVSRNIIAKTNKELGQMHVVKMRIATGNYLLMKLMSYQNPVCKGKLVKEAVDNMICWIQA